MKRLLFVSNLFPDTAAPYFGLDNATVLHALAARHGWDIRVLCPRSSLSPGALFGRGLALACRAEDRAFDPRFVAVPYVPKLGGVANHTLMAAALRTPWVVLRKTFPFDVVLASWLFPDGAAAARLAEESGVPCLLITQGSDTHQYLLMPLRRRHILGTIGRSAGVIARSGDLARRLATAGADVAKLHTIYNGVDVTVFRLRDRAEARRQLGLPLDAKMFLFVGNFLEVKNPQLLVRAFARHCAASGGGSSLLIMAGKGPLSAEVAALAASLGVGAHVRLTGPLDSAQIASHMAAADLLCLSSRSEGFPNVILEALACGLPVLSTDVGGISELVTPELGMLVPEGDEPALSAALRACIDRAWDRGMIAATGARHSWAGAAAAYDSLLRSALPAGPGACG
ncbi:MAG: glycosyltransferase [Verrucomicrobiaceae bacterium]|nr:glycosyltransferase [Verrucomicrobiaceae bacterium]